MPRGTALASLVLTLLAMGPSAHAAPVAVTGSLSLTLGTSVPITVSVPIATSVDVTGPVVSIPAGVAVTTGQFAAVTGFPLNLVTGVVLTVSSGPGVFAPGAPAEGGPASVAGGGLGGTMPLHGVLQLRGPLALAIPLSVVGAGGGLSAGGVAVEGAPWTTGVGQVLVGAPPAGLVTGSGTRSGVVGVASSTLTLIAPTYVDMAGLGRAALFGRLSMHFVPEPSSAALVASVLAGWAGYRRWSRGSSAVRGR